MSDATRVQRSKDTQFMNNLHSSLRKSGGRSERLFILYLKEQANLYIAESRRQIIDISMARTLQVVVDKIDRLPGFVDSYWFSMQKGSDEAQIGITQSLPMAYRGLTHQVTNPWNIAVPFSMVKAYDIFDLTDKQLVESVAREA